LSQRPDGNLVIEATLKSSAVFIDRLAGRAIACVSQRPAGVVDNIAHSSARAICRVPAAPVAICFETLLDTMRKQVAGFVDKSGLNLCSNAGPKPLNRRSKVVRRYFRSAQLPPAYIPRHLAGNDARLGADVVHYSFIVTDLHHLLLAGHPAH
jgi:hypothetical protein